ncbi:hypothetical protein BCV72DRAFT_251914 [Rhizopus microsporus var. microsporus]|uniref:BCS1 N-terminal domain-containing protein n=1 Tax=Rhizopus microsporus var. microsporus TaxID=86635 RepID=A0A1X0QUE0_RHIZD|nr:hypothetical protein BCV72DRAFT_251914 [Rhizopus microsporus var. microsporus]
MSLATIVNSRILPPHVPIILNNRIVSRSISSVPPEPGTIGGIVAAIAEKLGIGELATGGLQLAVLGANSSISWILNWLNDQPYSKITSRFSVSTSILRAGQRLPGEGLDALTPPVYFLPSPEISTFGQSRELIQSLVYEAQKKFMDRDKSRTVVFAADQYGAWRRTRSRPKRPLSTVVIPDHVKTTLVDDAQEFLVSEQWYSDRGIPYRRGYLLYGTPGSGKTSFVYSLAVRAPETRKIPNCNNDLIG